MPHTQSFIANGVDQEFEIPVGSTVTAVTVDAVAAPYTTPLPWLVRVTTLPTSGQAVAITYAPALAASLGAAIKYPTGPDIPTPTIGSDLAITNGANTVVLSDATGVVRSFESNLSRRIASAVNNPGQTGYTSTGAITISASGSGSASWSFVDAYLNWPRVRYTSTAAINQMAGVFIQNVGMGRSATAGLGGFDLEFIFGLGALNNSSIVYVGAHNANATLSASAEASVDLNGLAFALDSTDSEWQFQHNDGSGVCTKIPLGADFPRPTVGVDIYSARIWCAPGSLEVFYRLQKLNDPSKVVSGSVSGANLPVAETQMYPLCLAKTGPSVATAVQMDIHRFTAIMPK